MVTNKVPRFHVYDGSDVENLALQNIEKNFGSQGCGRNQWVLDTLKSVQSKHFSYNMSNN